MSSRKAQKEELRAQREAAERAEAQSSQRRRRLAQLAAVVGLAAIVVVIAVVIGSGSGSDGASDGIAKGSDADGLVGEVNSTLNGIPQAGNRLGAADAPVTLEYYGDLQCPVCKDFSLGALSQVIAQPVRAAKVKVEFRALQTATQDPATFDDQQAAALAAGEQNRLWQFVELFYRQQGLEGTGYVTDGFLAGIADQVPGLDKQKWSSARKAAELRDELQSQEQAAQAAGASATPTLVIRGPGGKKVLSGDVPFDQISTAVDSVSS